MSAVRRTLRVVLTTVIVPLAILALGLWELSRGADEQRDLEQQRSELAAVVQRLESRPTPQRGSDMGARFVHRGQVYAGPIAVQHARTDLSELDTALWVLQIRRILPPITILCAALTAALSITALIAAALLARAGRASRDALVRGFSVARGAMPPLLGVHVMLLAICTVTVVAFEALAIIEVGEYSSGSVKLLMIALAMAGASLWTALKAIIQLRRTVALFTPDPMLIHGRPVTPQDAPGLWHLVDDLARRLDALRPDTIVLGLMGGFFVTSGPKLLRPGDIPLEGRTLYVPLPYLPLLHPDEIAAIIGHELAHFSGADTEYSLRFLPIYAGVERSLDSVLRAGTTSAGGVALLTRPALRLGYFAMQQFHHAVQHWSRVREFAADAAGASVTTQDAAARALLRVAAVDPVIQDTLDEAMMAPRTAPPDLVTSTLHTVLEHGLESPAPRLEQHQPHPTDSHPTTRQRLAALHHEPGPATLDHATTPPPPDAMASLATLFADPDRLCRRATQDFLDVARTRARVIHQHLEQTAGAIDPDEQALSPNDRPRSYVLLGMGLVFLLIGAAILVFRPGGLSPAMAQLVAGIAALCGIVVGGLGAVLLRPNTPFLFLRPEGFSLPGLDRPILWQHVADMDVTVLRGGQVSTRVLLPPEASFPTRTPGSRGVQIDPQRRIVTYAAILPRGLKVQDYAKLLMRYRAADEARRELAAETVLPED